MELLSVLKRGDGHEVCDSSLPGNIRLRRGESHSNTSEEAQENNQGTSFHNGILYISDEKDYEVHHTTTRIVHYWIISQFL
jgi:hypothetical protein